MAGAPSLSSLLSLCVCACGSTYGYLKSVPPAKDHQEHTLFSFVNFLQQEKLSPEEKRGGSQYEGVKMGLAQDLGLC